jgi:hypothetical protein
VTVKDVYRCTVRGGWLGDEVTSRTQAVQSIANSLGLRVYRVSSFRFNVQCVGYIV